MKPRKTAHPHRCHRCGTEGDWGEWVGAEGDYFWCGACLEASDKRAREAEEERARVLARAIRMETE